MVPKQATRDRSTGLAQAIERQIVQRTWGRIHRLQVELIGDRVIIHGCTSTYYAKQLALEGVLDVVGTDGSAQVEMDVQVNGRSPSAVHNLVNHVYRPSA